LRKRIGNDENKEERIIWEMLYRKERRNGEVGRWIEGK
jgi:hypothetical protein